MKIALVSPYDFAYPGGVTNHISSLYYYLSQMGHDVKVIAPISKAVSAFGDRFIPIGRPRSIPTSGSIARVTISTRLAPTIKAVLEKENFDIIHLHEPFMPMLCTTVLRRSNGNLVGTFHAFAGSPGYNFCKPLTIRWLRKWCNKLKGKIAVSEPARDFVNSHLPGHYEIIPNGVDLKHFSPDVPPIDKFCDGKLNILFTGRLEKRKGVNYLLKAYPRVKEEIPDARLIIVGPGTRLRNKYEKYVRKNNLKDVVFTGHVSYEDLPRYYKTADVFCAPATGSESFGIILLEAMAVGTPIVASNIEGYSRLVTPGAEGLLVPPRDDKTLAQSLISLLKDEPLRRQMGARGIVKAKSYDWEVLAQRIVDYYSSILNNTPQEKQPVESGGRSDQVITR
jgi:phosphatidylinositol alpha-mannosyltransferase